MLTAGRQLADCYLAPPASPPSDDEEWYVELWPLWVVLAVLLEALIVVLCVVYQQGLCKRRVQPADTEPPLVQSIECMLGCLSKHARRPEVVLQAVYCMYARRELLIPGGLPSGEYPAEERRWLELARIIAQAVDRYRLVITLDVPGSIEEQQANGIANAVAAAISSSAGSVNAQADVDVAAHDATPKTNEQYSGHHQVTHSALSRDDASDYRITRLSVTVTADALALDRLMAALATSLQSRDAASKYFGAQCYELYQMQIVKETERGAEVDPGVPVRGCTPRQPSYPQHPLLGSAAPRVETAAGYGAQQYERPRPGAAAPRVEQASGVGLMGGMTPLRAPLTASGLTPLQSSGGPKLMPLGAAAAEARAKADAEVQQALQKSQNRPAMRPPALARDASSMVDQGVMAAERAAEDARRKREAEEAAVRAENAQRGAAYAQAAAEEAARQDAEERARKAAEEVLANEEKRRADEKAERVKALVEEKRLKREREKAGQY